MTPSTIAIAREAARLAFLCQSGWSLTAEEFEARGIVDSDSTFDQEKAELLAVIRYEFLQSHASGAGHLALDVYREVLLHLAGPLVGDKGSKGHTAGNASQVH